jgi:hypothetical protein
LKRVEVRVEETNMLEFPPVTMYTFPVRSGRESGWKVILGMNDGDQNDVARKTEE